jgi:hypothetical protein
MSGFTIPSDAKRWTENRKILENLFLRYYRLKNAPKQEQLDIPGFFLTEEDVLKQITSRATTFDEWALIYMRIGGDMREVCMQRMAVLAVTDLELFELFSAVILAMATMNDYEPLPWGIGSYEHTLPFLLRDERINPKIRMWLGYLDAIWKRISSRPWRSESLRELAERYRYEPWRSLAELRMTQQDNEERARRARPWRRKVSC